MSQALLLRLHRWISLVFALPLLVVIGTGLILSFQPIVQMSSIRPNMLTAEKLESYVKRFDPQGQARNLSVDAYENTLTLNGVGPDGSIDVDLATGEEATADDGWISDLFSNSRRLHEHFLFNLGWVVTASTYAMIALASLGVLMGWPRLRNTVSGWHKGIAWFLLPFIMVSLVSGLGVAYGITFAPAQANVAGAPRAQPVALLEAVRLVSAHTDPSNLLSLGTRGGRQLARIVENGEVRAYRVTREGLQPGPRNWPRLLHEGNWLGIWSGLANAVTSLAMLALLGTGLVIWARRKFRRPTRERSRRSVPAAQTAEGEIR
ncbi:MAG: PepSY protein [Hyphomicrobiales bacterium]|nr:PepSY protein [Hyphomicrobiales bacterium]